ncbi:MAG: DUF6279 family lipoprotein [Gammaproteobacteria bacterium]
MRTMAVKNPCTMRVAALFLAAMVLAGCATQLAYRNADFLLTTYIEDYVPLERAQEEELEWRIDALLAWHSREALPEYARWLREVGAAIGDGEPLAASRVRTWAEDLRGFWQELARRAAPDLVALGTSLSDEQVQAFVARLEEEHAERVEEYGERSPEEQLERREERMEEFISRWTGRLSREQVDMIRRWAAAVRPATDLWLENRAHRIDLTREALARREEPGALAEAVETLVVDTRPHWSESYRAVVEHNTALTTDFLARFKEALDPKQRARARARLEELAEEMEALVPEPAR